MPWGTIAAAFAILVMTALIMERGHYGTGRIDLAPIMTDGEAAGAAHPMFSQMDVDSKMLAIADNMKVWHNAALVFGAANPGYVGVIPAASLVVPSWYSPVEGWISVMGTGNVVATYFAGDGHAVTPARLSAALLQRMAGYEGAGLVSSGMVASGYSGSILTAPAGVPNGSVAIVTEVGP